MGQSTFSNVLHIKGEAVVPLYPTMFTLQSDITHAAALTFVLGQNLIYFSVHEKRHTE